MVTRTSDKVPFSEVEPLFNLLIESTAKGTDTVGQIVHTIGYSPGNYNKWAGDGFVRRSIKYALMGLAYDLGIFQHVEDSDNNGVTSFMWPFDARETEVLMAANTISRSKLGTYHEDVLDSIQATIMKAMGKFVTHNGD